MTYMFILKRALKLVLKNILYYDARSEKHQIYEFLCYVQHILQTESYNARNYSENVWIQSTGKSIERY